MGGERQDVHALSASTPTLVAAVDWAVVAALHRTAWIEAHGHCPFTDAEAEQRWRSASDLTVRMGALDDRPVGFIAWRDEHAARTVTDLFVAAGCRRRGVGQMLLSAALSVRMPVRLLVAADNPAWRLYEQSGFLPTGATAVGADGFRRSEMARPAPV